MWTSALYCLKLFWTGLVYLFLVAGGIWAILELPASIRHRYQEFQDWRAERSFQSAPIRLLKLIQAREVLGLQPEINGSQAIFYSLVCYCFLFLSFAGTLFTIGILYSHISPTLSVPWWKQPTDEMGISLMHNLGRPAVRYFVLVILMMFFVSMTSIGGILYTRTFWSSEREAEERRLDRRMKAMRSKINEWERKYYDPNAKSD